MNTWEEVIRASEPIRFTVRGLPQAQGSVRAFVNRATGRAMVATEGNKPRSPLGAWRTAIAAEARAAIGDRPVLEGPLALTVTYRLPRPRAHFGTGRNASILKPSAPAYVPTKPDIDKLLRAVLDALTGVVFRDDAQVAMLWSAKQYDSGVTGCTVTVRPVLPDEVGS
jgi:Holliday junction resolvase RusA-like endonuclease